MTAFTEVDLVLDRHCGLCSLWDGQMMASFNERQVNRMRQFMREYEGGGATLSSLVSNLGGWLDILEGADESWREGVRTELGTLDTINSVALAREETRLNADDQALVSEALRAIEGLLHSAPA